MHDSKHGTSAISNHPVPLLSMTELISRSQSAKARWAVRSAHDVFVPKNLQRHMLALQLAVDLRPVRLRAPTMTRLRPGCLVNPGLHR